MKIEAKPTVYKGYHFRSRLEARWAVFFDALGLEWEYEKESYDLPCGSYLPDFWLSDVKMWAEVKPYYPFEQTAYTKASQLAQLTAFPVLLLGGNPENTPYLAIHPDTSVYDYCLTNYHDYPKSEHRFYACPGGKDDSYWQDTELASMAARSAQFEFGKHGATL